MCMGRAKQILVLNTLVLYLEKMLFNSFHRHKEIGNAKSQINQAEDQKDSLKIAEPSTYSQPAIQSIPSTATETFQPKDLWQTAYDQLDEDLQQILLCTQSSTESSDQKAGSRELVDEIIQVTKQKYEEYQRKSDQTLRKTSR
ncbi:hypothetical protein N7495_003365 [Penicillium taxi]|uniref:uncharacterized protein n=1 Tax=Penicillium taxi TaxID=168475 RepID=UPI00254569D0|nr:uncharacterized protein N7495_003365 [Penicillium taxi]KAJ5902837.1 hypothetical protein N7495_003365 [Penicillium taxi]